MNEALILTTLDDGHASSVADVARRLSTLDIGRSIDDGSIYLALKRMSERGFVSVTRSTVISADNRSRVIGFYAITPQGRQTVNQFAREASVITRLSPSPAAKPLISRLSLSPARKS